MKNTTSRNRSLMQLIGFHDAQHRHSRSESLGNLKSNSTPMQAPGYANDVSMLQNDATFSESQLRSVAAEHYDDSIPEMLF
jgi:hypothetical protein